MGGRIQVDKSKIFRIFALASLLSGLWGNHASEAIDLTNNIFLFCLLPRLKESR